jgi:signal peptidase II
LFYGYVVDFIDVDFFKVSILGHNYDRFPVFNIADAAVTIGVFLLLIFYRKNQEVPGESLQSGAGGTVEGTESNDSATDSSKKESQPSEE